MHAYVCVCPLARECVYVVCAPDCLYIVQNLTVLIPNREMAVVTLKMLFSTLDIQS